MAFVNEWISQEDIEKYGLVELCDSYRGDDYKYVGVKEPRRKTDWTIDREREIWLMRIARVTNPNYDLPSPTQETIFILHYLGVNIEVRLWWEPVSKPKVTPIQISWKYLSMDPKSIDGSDVEQLKAILKEAIQTYKHFGLLSKKTEITEIICIDFD
ncbi:hypothetical protein KKA17_08080 [bacterium]|nr:hypothetical protein [bacterium]MBU1883350.1 hypothetical protein [bacterium]